MSLYRIHPSSPRLKRTPVDAYLWLKAFHIISFVAWMAGLFYLPRLYVYHTQQAAGSDAAKTFMVMERKLLRIIMNPAMIASWIFGIALILAYPGIYLQAGWLHAKILLVVLLTGLHGMFAGWTRAFAQDRNRKSERFYRLINEAPTLLMIGIVILVVVVARGGMVP